MAVDTHINTYGRQRTSGVAESLHLIQRQQAEEEKEGLQKEFEVAGNRVFHTQKDW